MLNFYSYLYLKPFNCVHKKVGLIFKISPTKWIYLCIFDISIKGIWHWITSNGWYAIKLNQTNLVRIAKQSSSLSRFTTGLNSVFLLQLQYSRLKSPVCPNYLSIARGRIIVFIHFPRVLVVCEIWTGLFRIWTWVAESTFNGDSYYIIIMSDYFKK